MISGLDLVRRSGSVAGGRAILEVKGRAQSMRIQGAIERRWRGGYVGAAVRRDDRRSGHGKCGKGAVAANRGADRVTGHDSEMISGVRS